jgi:hypothetical protein
VTGERILERHGPFGWKARIAAIRKPGDSPIAEAAVRDA